MGRLLAQLDECNNGNDPAPQQRRDPQQRREHHLLAATAAAAASNDVLMPPSLSVSSLAAHPARDFPQELVRLFVHRSAATGQIWRMAVKDSGSCVAACSACIVTSPALGSRRRARARAASCAQQPAAGFGTMRRAHLQQGSRRINATSRDLACTRRTAASGASHRWIST